MVSAYGVAVDLIASGLDRPARVALDEQPDGLAYTVDEEGSDVTRSPRPAARLPGAAQAGI